MDALDAIFLSARGGQYPSLPGDHVFHSALRIAACSSSRNPVPLRRQEPRGQKWALPTVGKRAVVPRPLWKSWPVTQALHFLQIHGQMKDRRTGRERESTSIHPSTTVYQHFIISNDQIVIVVRWLFNLDVKQLWSSSNSNQTCFPKACHDTQWANEHTLQSSLRQVPVTDPRPRSKAPPYRC